jgi:transposase-like protein
LDRQAADQAVAAFIEKDQPVYPTAIACFQRDLEACLTFYAYPKTHWKTIRTNTIIERLEGSVKRRSHKMAAAFRTRSELCIAVLCGQSEFALQQTHYARFIYQATRRRDFTQPLTNYRNIPPFK